jgi:hypothetical protein
LKETDLYEPVKRWLEERGLTVYSEVSPDRTMKRADIVGIDSNVSYVVELKTSLSLDLLDQAIYWSRRKYANYIYIAIPWNKPSKRHHVKHWLIEHLCREFNIGIIFVNRPNGLIQNFHVGDEPYIKGKFIRINKEHNFQTVIEKFKVDYEKSNLPGGHNGGGYVTEYRSTINRVKELLETLRTGKGWVSLWWHQNGKLIDLRKSTTEGWIDINTILDYCETHYASPKPSLSKALREFEWEWCETKKEGRKLYFRHKLND